MRVLIQLTSQPLRTKAPRTKAHRTKADRTNPHRTKTHRTIAHRTKTHRTKAHRTRGFCVHRVPLVYVKHGTFSAPKVPLNVAAYPWNFVCATIYLRTDLFWRFHPHLTKTLSLAWLQKYVKTHSLRSSLPLCYSHRACSTCRIPMIIGK